jgi:hypothetical protein
MSATVIERSFPSLEEGGYGSASKCLHNVYTTEADQEPIGQALGG